MTPDLSVRKTEHYEGRDFICANHYTRGCHNRPMTWGLYHDARLVGACAFACPSSERVRAMLMGKDHVDKVSELHRLFVFDQSDWQDRCDNVTSWLVTRALEGLYAYKPNLRAILTYADSTEGHTGGIYKSCNAYPPRHVGGQDHVLPGPDGALAPSETVRCEHIEGRGRRAWLD